MINLKGSHESAPDGVSSLNATEAIVVVLAAVNLLHLNVKPEDIGVITFYSGQRELLKTTLSLHPCIPEWVAKVRII